MNMKLGILIVIVLSFLLLAISCGKSGDSNSASGENGNPNTPFYIVKFDTNGGAHIGQISAAEGASVVLPLPVRGDFVFTGWYYGLELVGLNGALYTVNTDVTLKAKWGYDVVFIANGGSEVTDSYNNITQFVSLPTTTKEKANFLGWFTDNNTYANQITVSYVLTSDLTLYAKWEQDQLGSYNVNFVLNGGSGVDNISGVSLIIERIPTKAGFIFGGWYNDNGLTGNMRKFPLSITENTVLYARWVAEPGFTVTFDTNGGAPVQSMVGIARILYMPMTDLGGYLFWSWIDGTSSVSFPYAVKNDTTLTAIWMNVTEGCDLAPRWRTLFEFMFNG